MRAEVFDTFSSNEGTHWWHVGKYACALHLLRELQVEGRQVLEIGASFGTLSRKIAAFADCAALDQSLEALRAGGYPRAVCGDATRLPFQDESFDMVVALDVLEHLEDDRACVSEAFRVLRPRGHALFFVPACPVLWSDLDEINHHHRRYTREGLVRLFEEDSEVEIVKLSYFNFFLFGPILVVRIIQRAMKHWWGQLSTASMKAPPAPINAMLKRFFLMEGRLVSRVDFPIGVSLILAARKAG